MTASRPAPRRLPELGPLGLPGIDDVPDALRMLMTVGLAGLLVILRFDAERFNAAEYNDIDRWGRQPSLARRLAWYVLGIGLILVVLKVYPDPVNDLYLSLGDRAGRCSSASPTARSAPRSRWASRSTATTTCGSRASGCTRATSSTRSRRRSSTRPCSAGWCSGFLLMTPMNPNLANLTQALLYALATRLGAPGRPWYMLAAMIAIGLASGWLTVITGGIGAAFIGHAITRVAIFLTTGHAGIPKAEGDRGRGDRAPPPDARGLAGPRPAVGARRLAA